MRRYLVAAVSAVLVLSACGNTDDTNPTDATRPPAVATTDALAPLAGTTLDDKPFDPAKLRGKSVVLWFWAPWCTICRGEAPSVAKLVEELDAEVTFVGVPGLGPRDDMKDFVSDTQVDALTHLPDDNGTIWSSYGITGQPAWVFITPSGEVSSFSGALGYDKLKDAAESLTLDG